MSDNPFLDLLSGAGYVLDTPGSLVRGLVAGEPGRALGGLLDPSQRVSGDELAGNLGMGEGLGRTAVGFGADVLSNMAAGIPIGLAGRALAGRVLSKASPEVAAAPKALKVAEELSPYQKAISE